MKSYLTCCFFLTLAVTTRAATFTNSTSADAFVRAAAPALDYGSAGALSVSGPDAVNGMGTANGRFDSLLRFNVAAMIANFDARFGANQWAVLEARLRVTEQGAPANALFNRGVGTFEIRWLANDVWVEGAGNPNNPASTGVVYNDVTTLLNGAADASLGNFSNAGVDGSLSFPLALPAGFLGDLRAGGEVGLFLTAIDPGVGFTFNSRSIATVAARPALEITAAPVPVLTGCTISDNDVVLAATKGEASASYTVLASDDISSPLEEWQPVATEDLATSGDFTITIPGAAPVGATQRFFMLRVTGQSNALSSGSQE